MAYLRSIGRRALSGGADGLLRASRRRRAGDNLFGPPTAVPTTLALLSGGVLSGEVFYRIGRSKGRKQGRKEEERKSPERKFAEEILSNPFVITGIVTGTTYGVVKTYSTLKGGRRRSKKGIWWRKPEVLSQRGSY